MANLKEIRTRISSVTSTKQITSAMKMVSAAKLRKAQDAIIQIRPYADKLHEILTEIISSIKVEKNNPFTQYRETKKVLIVLITSNRGLCGAFNSNAIKAALQLVKEKYNKQLENDNVSFYAIGKTGFNFLKSKKYQIAQSETEIFDYLTFENISIIVNDVMESFVKKQFDSIELVYNGFKNAASQILTTEQFLPIDTSKFIEADAIPSDYIFEPTKERIVEELIPKSLKIQFYKALLDSHAAEHGARMTAMHKATDNATELLKDLRLHYNKARQAAITGEILEIVGGADALKG